MHKFYLLFSMILFLLPTFLFAKDAEPIEKIINQDRVQRQLGPLIVNEKIQCAAKLHVLDIGKSRLCTHTGKDRTNMKQRLKKCGFDVVVGDELLACAFATPEAAFKAWIDSPKQKQIVTDTKYSDIGCAEYQNYYVCILTR